VLRPHKAGFERDRRVQRQRIEGARDRGCGHIHLALAVASVPAPATPTFAGSVQGPSLAYRYKRFETGLAVADTSPTSLLLGSLFESLHSKPKDLVMQGRGEFGRKPRGDRVVPPIHFVRDSPIFVHHRFGPPMLQLPLPEFRPVVKLRLDTRHDPLVQGGVAEDPGIAENWLLR
jgi:hypothetical protein